MSWKFILALAIDGIGILAALYFVVTDSIRGYGGSNGILPLLTLIFGAWLALSFYLYHHGHPTIASAMAWIPAIPLIGYGLFVLMFIILKPDMR